MDIKIAPQRGRVSQLGRHLLSAKNCLQIVESFQNNAPQCIIAMTLNVSLSTVHTIIKRLRESGGLSVCEGHTGKSLLNACDHKASR